ncbi:MAG: hypothetical protein ABQ298_10320 [Puniceicoccaceae bacterium]
MKINPSLPTLLAALLMAGVMLYTSMTSTHNHAHAIGDAAASTDSVEVAQIMGLDLTDDQRRAQALVGALPVEDVLGALAPIALSPFFALTCLSGASLMSEAGLLPESVGNNFMMSTSSPLNNSTVFVGLLVLTLLTAAPKLTKVSKPFAQAVDQVEAYSGIIAALAVQVLSRVSMDEPATAEVAMVYSAGLISMSYSTLIMVFSAINIFVINSVKFFCEVMILISPIPTVDAFFEAFNKAFTGILVAVYLISPWLATLLNLLIFLISLMVFSWTYRRVVFMRCVLADPIFGWIGEAMLRLRRMTVNSTRLPASVQRELPDATVVLKAFLGKKARGFKKKTRGFLVHSGGATYFVKSRWFRSNKQIQLSGEGVDVTVEPGFFCHGVAFRDRSGELLQKALFTKRYNANLEAIHRELQARGEVTTATQAPGFQDVGRDLARTVKATDGKGTLRSEFS